jgi:lipopolysaccharide export system permease protein
VIFVKKLYKELLQQMLLIFLILILIISIGQMVKLLKLMAAGKITLLALFKLLALAIPSSLGVLIPPCLLLAILLVLSRYYLDSEMAVMFASGVSLKRVFSWVLVFSCGVMVVVGVIAFVISPYTAVKKKIGFKYALMELTLNKVIPKEFTSLNADSVLYATNKEPDGNGLQQVYLFSKNKGDKQNEWNVLQAQRLQNAPAFPDLISGPFFQFNHGSLDHIAAQNLQWRQSNFNKLLYEIPGFDQEVNVWPRNLGLNGLWQASHTADTDYHSRLALGFLIAKISTVVSVFVMGFWGCVLGYAKPRQGKVAALLPALLLFGLYNYCFTLLQKNITSGSWPPWESFFLVHGGAFFIGLILLCLRFRDVILSRFKKGGAS